jgi:hypothetical protein
VIRWLLLLVLLSGCATSPTITLPAPPKWVEPRQPTFTSAEVRSALAILAPYAVVETSDDTFTPVDHEWLLAMVRWSDLFLRTTGHTYTPESFDCDKFAAAFALGVNWVAGDAGVKAQPLVARIFVAQTHSFANIVGAAGSSHALIGFRSNRGLFVLEPQGGRDGTPVFLRLAPLSEYPNRITRVKLGG